MKSEKELKSEVLNEMIEELRTQIKEKEINYYKCLKNKLKQEILSEMRFYQTGDVSVDEEGRGIIEKAKFDAVKLDGELKHLRTNLEALEKVKNGMRHF